MQHQHPSDEAHSPTRCGDINKKNSQPKKEESLSTSPPPIQFHSRQELALAEKCIKKLDVDSRFFPAQAADTDWFQSSHFTVADNGGDIKNLYEASTTVTALFEHELSVGRLLGTGGFCQVRAVRLQKQQQRLEQEDDEDLQRRQYAIKYLCPNIKKKSRKAFARGAADLAIEARFLSLLSHENIITLHHVSAGSLRETYNCSDDGGFNLINEKSLRNYGYFLILDYLTGTLDGRIERTYIPQVTKYLGEHPNKHHEHEHHRCDTRHHPLKFGPSKQQHSPQPHWWNFSAWHHEQSSRQEDSNQPLRQLLAQRLTILKSIASALQYLHENNIIMRDCKPNNIGFYNNGQEEIPKLFDFGLVKEMKPSNRTSYVHECPVSKIVSVLNDYPVYKLTGRTGSRRYMSPEVAFSRPYNEKADVYSFGILLYEISSLLQPFQGWTLDTHEEQVLKRHHRPCLVGYTHWPDELFSLISDCWEGVMWHRPDMKEVVQRLDECINVLDHHLGDSTDAGQRKKAAESTSSKCCCPSAKDRDEHKNKHKFKQYLSSAASVFPDIPTLKPEPASPFYSTGEKSHTHEQ
ncbi:MAP3K-like serine/threonine kinase [Skeletonema marinoi]|uniref:MAP3K-like serine/threonine kinase n=2 Tax=Skeletonema marinoi TaxID=267567 RepID=A0AAD9DAQ8_9STRA|nr:MAP3K-like serine/threonine kinase [Skeletonema marinoi]